jgi:hypothetical protein
MTGAEAAFREVRRKLHEIADRQMWAVEAWSVIEEMRDWTTERITDAGGRATAAELRVGDLVDITHTGTVIGVTPMSGHLGALLEIQVGEHVLTRRQHMPGLTIRVTERPVETVQPTGGVL